MTPDLLRAGIYCRLSLAKFGDSTKVDEQERICRELCGRRGWAVAEVYTDNNRSAWQRNRKRKDWDRMLADVEAGKLDAIVVYHGDRLVRQPYDLECLLNLAYGKGIRLASPTGVRDLGNDDDLFILRIEVAAQCRESAGTSRRKKSQYDRMRRQGLVRSGGRGGRAFGFATDGVTHVPAECAVVREMTDRVLAGESAGVIARDLTARGERTPTGGPFTHTTLRKMLARPRYAGLMPDGVNTAAWAPVLERDTWEAARLVLDVNAARFGFAVNARRWLLSGIACCGVCGTPLQIKPSQGRGHKDYVNGYGCVQPGCRRVYRSAPLLDAYVSRRVVNRLAHPENPAGMAADADFGREFTQLGTERAATEATVRDYRTRPGRVELLMARLDSIDERLAELRQLAGDSSRVRVMDAHTGITAEEFAVLPLGIRRALVAACYDDPGAARVEAGPGVQDRGRRADSPGDPL